VGWWAAKHTFAPAGLFVHGHLRARDRAELAELGSQVVVVELVELAPAHLAHHEEVCAGGTLGVWAPTTTTTTTTTGRPRRAAAGSGRIIVSGAGPRGLARDLVPVVRPAVLWVDLLRPLRVVRRGRRLLRLLLLHLLVVGLHLHLLVVGGGRVVLGGGGVCALLLRQRRVLLLQLRELCLQLRYLLPQPCRLALQRLLLSRRGGAVGRGGRRRARCRRRAVDGHGGSVSRRLCNRLLRGPSTRGVLGCRGRFGRLLSRRRAVGRWRPGLPRALLPRDRLCRLVLCHAGGDAIVAWWPRWFICYHP